MLGAQVLGVLQRRVVAGLLRLQRRSASSSVCFGTSCRLCSSLARSNACLAWTSSALRLLHVGRLLDRRAGAAESAAPYFASARASAACCCSRLYCCFSRSSSTSTCPAVTRSPRSARIRLTLPSASDETVTSSSAASVPTTSTVRRTVSWRTASTCTGFAATSRPRAWAVSDFEQPPPASAAATMTTTKLTHRNSDLWMVETFEV